MKRLVCTNAYYIFLSSRKVTKFSGILRFYDECFMKRTCSELVFQGRHGHGGGIGAALGQFAGALFNEFSGGHERPHHKHHPPHQHPPPVCEVLKKATHI
jgi:hypothetical protein